MDKLNSWEKILKLVKVSITPANFKTWFLATDIGEITDEKIIICVPSAFVKNQLVSRYGELINLSIRDVLNKELLIEYRIEPSLITKSKTTQSQDEIENETFTFISPQISNQTSNINPKYTLVNFVVGLTNNLAFAAAQAIVASPGTTYNPLFIYGPSGVGKTHLMHAIANALISKNPFVKVICVSSERFMVDFVDSIQNKKTGEFRSKYRSCDLLLVDDIQFISGKDSTQEEFFHTFNETYAKGAQVVLTADRPPNDIQKLEPRLSSRFQGGLMVDIQLPDFDTRVAILKAKLAERGEILPEDCLNLIAETIESNTRELEGKLIQILSMINLTNQEANIDNVRKFLGASSQQNALLDPKKVLGGINQYFNIRMSDLIGPRRQKELVIPRQIAMYLLYSECKVSMERVGEMLGGRDHTTILHGVRKINTSLQTDSEIKRLINEVRQSLGR